MSDPALQSVPNFDKLKIVKTGVGTVSSGSATNTSTIAHGLGYRPTIIAFLNDVGFTVGGTVIFTHGDIPLPTYLSETHSLADGYMKVSSYIHAAVDATNVYLILLNATGSSIGTFEVKYYLMRESSN